MHYALDTNSMVHLEGVDDLERRLKARQLLDAMEISATHQFAIRDAIVPAGAAQAGCRALWSAANAKRFGEDMQHGFTWRGITVRDPFQPDP